MMSVEFVNAQPAHRHAEHVDSIIEYANTLSADPLFRNAFNLFAVYPEVNVHLQLLRIEVEVSYDMHGIETDVYAATVSRDRVRLNQKVLDRIGAISPSREADLLQVFLAYTLAAHEVGHVLIRHDLPDEKQEYRMTPESFKVAFVPGKEAGRFLENMINKGILHLICQRNVHWTSETNIKALRLMLIDMDGEKELDTDAAFQQRKVIPMPTTGPLVLAHHEIVRKESGVKFKPAVQYCGEELDSQCGIFAFPDPPK
jgi:hypothetical protein